MDHHSNVSGKFFKVWTEWKWVLFGMFLLQFLFWSINVYCAKQLYETCTELPPPDEWNVTVEFYDPIARLEQTRILRDVEKEQLYDALSGMTYQGLVHAKEKRMLAQNRYYVLSFSNGTESFPTFTLGDTAYATGDLAEVSLDNTRPALEYLASLFLGESAS